MGYKETQPRKRTLSGNHLTVFYTESKHFSPAFAVCSQVKGRCRGYHGLPQINQELAPTTQKRGKTTAWGCRLPGSSPDMMQNLLALVVVLLQPGP